MLYAVANDYIEIVKYLLSNGAPIHKNLFYYTKSTEMKEYLFLMVFLIKN